MPKCVIDIARQGPADPTFLFQELGFTHYMIYTYAYATYRPPLFHAVRKGSERDIPFYSYLREIQEPTSR